MINLTDIFYELLGEGYIYEEDEDGLNMSYGEYAAICEYVWDKIKSSLSGIYDIIEFLETASEIFETADDDACMFFGLNDDEKFIEIDYDDPSNSYVGESLREIMNDIEFNEYIKDEYEE